MEGLVNGWWVGGEGGLLVGRIGGKGGLFCSRAGGKGGRVKEVAVIRIFLFSLF